MFINEKFFKILSTLNLTNLKFQSSEECDKITIYIPIRLRIEDAHFLARGLYEYIYKFRYFEFIERIINFVPIFKAQELWLNF